MAYLEPLGQFGKTFLNVTKSYKNGVFLLEVIDFWLQAFRAFGIDFW